MRPAENPPRDALAKTQAAFFDAIQYLYTWPSEQLAFATGMDIRDFWETHLDTVKQCAYKAETIDPNQPGSIRYDIMAEIVQLEERRSTVSSPNSNFSKKISAMKQKISKKKNVTTT